jgi:quercetin dioxygenase-like cupin family protein
MTILRGATNCAAAAALIASPLFTAPALATPGFNFGPPSLVVNGHFGKVQVNTAGDKTDKWGMVLKTLDDTDIGSDRITIQASGFSGWHAHPAPVFVTVTQGSIVWVNGSDPLCTPHPFSSGESFIEDAYVIHDVRNASSSESAEYIAIRMNPTGVAFRLDRDEPNNCD